MALTTYCQDEIVSVSQLSRNLKKLMDQLCDKKKYKFGIIKNNQIKAALVSAEFLEEVERLIQIYQASRKQKSGTLQEIEARYC